MSRTVSAPPSVLTFAPGDATSGTGVQSDVLTLASMGCHPLAVVCGIVSRDTRGIEDFGPLEPDVLVSQARAVLEDIPVRAFKLGMVGSVPNLAAVAEILSDYPEVPLVVEPALSCLSREDDASDDYLSVFVDLIVPHADVVVAAPSELLRLAECMIEPDEEHALDSENAAGGLLNAGARHVLITDAGEPGPQLNNVLLARGGIVRNDVWERLEGHFLGGRATLAAAIAAACAHGMEIPEAVREAQEFVWQALKAAYRPGMGLSLPDRLFWGRSGDYDHD